MELIVNRGNLKNEIINLNIGNSNFMKHSRIPVTLDNFTRAETDMYFSKAAVREGGFGKFSHHRDLLSVDNQSVVRGNRDTLHSTGVFDLDAGPVTVSLPEAGNRFMSLMVMNEDQYTCAVYYGAGSYTVTKQQAGTRYVMIALQTFVDPSNPDDINEVHVLQDSSAISQPDGPGKFEVPEWDAESQRKIRTALRILGETMPEFTNTFSNKENLDQVRHLVGAASGWGAKPDKDAVYLNIVPEYNDGKVPYMLTVKDVPVDGFWSLSVYNEQGYFEKNDKNAYSLNNITAKKNDDGSITVYFGGDENAENYLPIIRGWNYTVRLYHPRKEILDGSWKFPEAKPVGYSL